MAFSGRPSGLPTSENRSPKPKPDRLGIGISNTDKWLEIFRLFAGHLRFSSDSSLEMIAFAGHFQGLLDMSDVTDLQISESLSLELLIIDDVNYCE